MRRFRQHINPLKMTSLIPREPIALPAETSTVVEVELGCGEGAFTIRRAQQNPTHVCIGCDIREEFLAAGHAEIATANVPNARLEVCNLLVDFGHLFSQGRIDRFFINFPDPWFKRRQQNRRWLTSAALDALITALKPGGEIFFQSDVWELTMDAMALCEAAARSQASQALKNVGEPWTFYRNNPYGVTSTREDICTRDDLPIWRILYRKLP